MSVNRFRRIAPVLDPTMYRFKERLQLPDLSGIGQIASALQTSYDTKIPRPQHIQKDAPLVDQYFVKPVEDFKSKAVDAFKSGDTSQGINYMKQMEQFIYNAKQPGGAYNAFEDNYKRAQDYIKSTTDNKDISKDTKDFSINKSLGNFQTFDQAGNRQVFQGYTPAKDVDLNDYFTKLTKDWAETEWVKGYSKTLGGQYFDQRTGKKVSKEEIVNSLRDSWMNNPDVKPYIQQLAEMYGEDEALKRVSSAINLAAEKEAFESETSKLVGNKEYDISGQMRVAKYKKGLEEETPTSNLLAPFQYSPFPSKSLDLKDGKIKTKESDVSVTGVPSQFGGSAGAGVPISKPVYENKGFNQIVNDPKYKSYFDERPGLKTVIEATPATGMKPTDYNNLIAKRYESMQKNSGKSLAYTSLGDRDIKKINSYMLGDKKDDVGAIVNHSVTLLSANGAPQRIDASEIAANKGAITFYGKSEGGNGFYPGSIFGTYKKGKQVYNIVVEPISYEASEHYKGLKSLSQPTATYKESGWQTVNVPGQGKVTIKSKPILKFDENNQLQDVDLEFYVPANESGTKMNKLEGWNKQSVQNLWEQSSPLMNADQIKTGTVIK